MTSYSTERPKASRYDVILKTQIDVAFIIVVLYGYFTSVEEFVVLSAVRFLSCAARCTRLPIAALG